MRLRLHLTPSTEPVPFSHQHRLMGVLHRWLGPDNAYHDGTSFYGFGMLRGGQRAGNGLVFPSGATWDVGFFDRSGTVDVVAGLLDDPGVIGGMRIQRVEPMPEPAFKFPHYFKGASPVVVRRREESGERHYLLYDDLRSDDALTDSFRRRLLAAGFIEPDLDAIIRFDRAYKGARTKLVTVRGVNHRGSVCPVWIYATPAALTFAWRVGVGDLTGSGFGMLA